MLQHVLKINLKGMEFHQDGRVFCLPTGTDQLFSFWEPKYFEISLVHGLTLEDKSLYSALSLTREFLVSEFTRQDFPQLSCK